jgi:hypothetical protein
LQASYAAAKGTGAVPTGPWLVALAADACRRVLSGSSRGWQPEVLVAAGLGLIGPDLDIAGRPGDPLKPSKATGTRRRAEPMTTDSGRRGGAAGIMDRLSERDALDRLIGVVRAGESRALVVRGDPGVGKSVLLDHLAERASGSGCRVARVVGVQSEMELAFAGLHQLCAPMLDHVGRIPVPQREALRTVFGLTGGPAPDRFFVGLAVLSLLSEVAGKRPLIGVIDDEQWLDQASAQALGFVARRLGADPVGLVFAAREPSAELAGLPELVVGGLQDGDARDPPGPAG